MDVPRLEPQLYHCLKCKDVFETLPTNVTRHKIPHLDDFTNSYISSIPLSRTSPSLDLKILHIISRYFSST